MIKIAIHSVPRSGSTWLGTIFDSHPNVLYNYQPLFSFSLKDFLNETSNFDEIDLFYSKLSENDDDFIRQKKSKELGLVPSFYKSNIQAIAYKEVRYHHLLPNILKQHNEIKLVCLIRNPLSTLHSWWKAPKEFRGDLGWDFNDEWRTAQKKNAKKPEEFNGYEKWKEAAYLFHRLKEEYNDKVCLVEYKCLLEDTQSEVERIFAFCQLDLTPQTVNFLKESSEKTVDDHYSVFREKQTDDKWKSELPEYIAAYVYEDLKGTMLDRYL